MSPCALISPRNSPSCTERLWPNSSALSSTRTRSDPWRRVRRGGRFGCLAVAYGFDAAGHAGLQEAIFRSSVSYRGTVACVHCGAKSPEFAGNRPDLPVE